MLQAADRQGHVDEVAGIVLPQASEMACRRFEHVHEQGIHRYAAFAKAGDEIDRSFEVGAENEVGEPPDLRLPNLVVPHLGRLRPSAPAGGRDDGSFGAMKKRQSRDDVGGDQPEKFRPARKDIGTPQDLRGNEMRVHGRMRTRNQLKRR
ncbi:hypothetical protein [uncultured Methylobacterium sp.]|uniref:hypothetical protein n=1 Tax=uncultured Methylobacterium sp. TaxID=157278 RepID=UPI0035CCA578